MWHVSAHEIGHRKCKVVTASPVRRFVRLFTYHISDFTLRLVLDFTNENETHVRCGYWIRIAIHVVITEQVFLPQALPVTKIQTAVAPACGVASLARLLPSHHGMHMSLASRLPLRRGRYNKGCPGDGGSQSPPVEERKPPDQMTLTMTLTASRRFSYAPDDAHGEPALPQPALPQDSVRSYRVSPSSDVCSERRNSVASLWQ